LKSFVSTAWAPPVALLQRDRKELWRDILILERRGQGNLQERREALRWVGVRCVLWPLDVLIIDNFNPPVQSVKRGLWSFEVRRNVVPGAGEIGGQTKA